MNPKTESLVEFQNRRRKWLRGMIHRPQKPAVRRRAPGVVFFHGFAGDRLESHWIFIKCARALARAGIASLRFDFYGSGESDGEFREMTLQGELRDAEDAVKLFRRKKGIHPERVGLCGLSLGGCVAACVARRVEAKALVLWSAVAHTEIFYVLAENRAKPALRKEGVLEYDAREVSPQFLKDAARIEPVKLLGRYKGPTLIIHPEKDESVPLSHAEDFLQTSPAPVKEKIIIPGADHTFTSLAWERDVIARTLEWFWNYL